MIAARTADGRFGSPGFPLGTRRARACGSRCCRASSTTRPRWLRNVKPFLIESSSQFRSAGPDPLSSLRYARDFNEVKTYGSAAMDSPRSADQTHAARYWAENPPGTWSRVFRTLSAQQGLSLVDNARLYAMLYLTAADALIGVWDDKAHYGFWRPITAIQRADTDGNEHTEKDAGWLPLIADAAVSRAPVGPRRPQRVVRGHAAGLLRHRPDRLDGHEQRRA